jgi:hypothetical protein
MGNTDIAILFNLGGRRGWVANTTTRPLYPKVSPCTHCIGGWVGLSAGVDGSGKSLPYRDLIPGQSEFWWRNLGERDQLEKPDVVGSIILK